MTERHLSPHERSAILHLLAAATAITNGESVNTVRDLVTMADGHMAELNTPKPKPLQAVLEDWYWNGSSISGLVGQIVNPDWKLAHHLLASNPTRRWITTSPVQTHRTEVRAQSMIETANSRYILGTPRP